jgi:uncharacterized protein YyaL (SSP411 family)
MKKLILGIFTFFLIHNINCQAQEVQNKLKWYNWNEGYKEAVRTNKIVLIDIYTDWCGWCKKMERDTYTHPEVVKLINKYFVAVKFNPEQRNVVYEVDGNKMNPQQLFSNLTQNQANGYPTTVFLFTKEKRVYLQAGYLDPANFLKVLNEYTAAK